MKEDVAVIHISSREILEAHADFCCKGLASFSGYSCSLPIRIIGRLRSIDVCGSQDNSVGQLIGWIGRDLVCCQTIDFGNDKVVLVDVEWMGFPPLTFISTIGFVDNGPFFRCTQHG